MIDQSRLLEELEREMFLSEARARGAKKTYELAAMSIAWRRCQFRPGDRIKIKFSDGDVLGVFDRIEWDYFEGGDEGPAIFGYEILKSGRLSKRRMRFCKADYENVTKEDAA